MEQLYELLNHLLENEYDLHAVIYMLDKLKEGYDEEKQKEQRYVVSVIQRYLEGVSGELRSSIDELDQFLATRDTSTASFK